MSLRNKTLIIIIMTLLSLITILYMSSRIIVLGGFVQIEEQRTHTNMERVLSALEEDLSSLERTAQDWSFWDDTYAFIEDANEDYIRSNLVDSAFSRLRLNLLMLVHTSGRIVAGSAFDLKENKQIPIPVSIQGHVSDGHLLLSRSIRESSVKGILLPEDPMLLVSQPVLTSQAEGPPRGILIMEGNSMPTLYANGWVASSEQ